MEDEIDFDLGEFGQINDENKILFVGFLLHNRLMGFKIYCITNQYNSGKYV